MIHALGPVCLVPLLFPLAVDDPAARVDDELEALADDELEARFHAVNEGGWDWNQEWRLQESILSEMVARGGDRWERVLAFELKRLEDPRIVGEDHEVEQPDLAVLTALRRIQDEPDPLGLTLRLGAGEDDPARFPRLPVVHVDVSNRDGEGRAFSFQRGGNYRGGRHARWQVEVRRAGGEPLDAAIEWSLGMGGGISSRFAFGVLDEWELDLPLADYVLLPSPGEYELRVLYHDTQTIADERDLDGVVATASNWMPLLVAPREDTIMASEVVQAVGWIDALEEGETVLLTQAHRTGNEKHDVEAVTAQEGLYWMGWKAVPLLIDALDDPGRSAHSRAWILGTLYSITGLHDPRAHRGVTGSYEIFMDSVWTPDGGMLGGHGSGSDGGPDFDRQAELVRRWQALRGGITLELEG